MARRYVLADGSSSFNGYDPASKTFCGYQFGWHNDYGKCARPDCRTFSHYSLHKRYKFSVKLENSCGGVDYNHDVKRLWICSDDCFKRLILAEMFECNVPPEVAEKVFLRS